MAVRDVNGVLWDVTSPAAGMWTATTDGYEGPRVRLEATSHDVLVVNMDAYAKDHAGSVKRSFVQRYWPIGALVAAISVGLAVLSRKR